jgi:predicted nucleic acid-binding protein
VAAELRYGAEKPESKQLSEWIDLLIAAHALAADILLVSANTREFQRVPALRVENWLIE